MASNGIVKGVKRRKELVYTTVIAFVIAVILRAFLFQGYYVTARSMEPTFTENDKVFINKIAYDLYAPSRGDIIVTSRPDGNEDVIKRVIGLPNEQISSIDGKIHINNEPLDEEWLSEGVFTEDFDTVTIPFNHIFIMGDNREGSLDSRSFGTVPIGEVDGRVFLVWWPLNEFRKL